MERLMIQSRNSKSYSTIVFRGRTISGKFKLWVQERLLRVPFAGWASIWVLQAILLSQEGKASSALADWIISFVRSRIGPNLKEEQKENRADRSQCWARGPRIQHLSPVEASRRPESDKKQMTYTKKCPNRRKPYQTHHISMPSRCIERTRERKNERHLQLVA